MKRKVQVVEEKKETAGKLRAETAAPTEKLTLAQNGDKDDLLPGGVGMFTTAYVDEVNCGAAQETPGFVPTRHELIQLAKYWYKRCLDNKWVFIKSELGIAGIPVGPYAERRIARIKELVGKEEVEDAIEELTKEYEAAVDARLEELFFRRKLTDQQWDVIDEGLEQIREGKQSMNFPFEATDWRVPTRNIRNPEARSGSGGGE